MNSPILFFDTHPFEKPFYLQSKYPILFLEFRLDESSVMTLPESRVACCFVNDRLNKRVLEELKKKNVQYIALRSAGFNHIQLPVAKELGFKVTRIPEYSPYSVAEHAVGLLLNCVRKIHRSYVRVHEFNFSLDGLVGFDIHGKTVGVIGTGKIGRVFVNIMQGFGARILAHDPYPNEELLKSKTVTYTDLNSLLSSSDIISLHSPLTPETHHMINSETIKLMKSNCVLINTSRGGLIDSQALITALKDKKIAAAGLDVYEEEENVFFQNLSEAVIDDDILARLNTFPNVIITSHQGFLTQEALKKMSSITFDNIDRFYNNEPLLYEIT